MHKQIFLLPLALPLLNPVLIVDLMRKDAVPLLPRPVLFPVPLFLLSRAEQGQHLSRIHVSDFIQIEGVETIRPDATVRDAAKLMLNKKVGCLPVVDGENRLQGIVCEADLLHLIAQG